MSSSPFFTIAYSVGKIFLYARSPVAPKKTNASERAGLATSGLLLVVPAEFLAHGRHHLVAEIGGAARREALVQGGGEDRGRYALVDRGDARPAAFARVGDPAFDIAQVGRDRERVRGQVQEPRGDDAAPAPHLCRGTDVDVVLVVLRLSQRRGLGVLGALVLAGVRVLEDVQALGVGGHDAVLDAVVHHLHEMTCAGRTAVEVSLLGRARITAEPRRAVNVAQAGCDRLEDRIEVGDDLVFALSLIHISEPTRRTPIS